MAHPGAEQIAELHPARPAAPLAALGIRYRGYRQEGFAAGAHRGLPSGVMTFIVTIDDPLDLRDTPPPLEAAGRFEAIAGGLHTSPAIIRHQGRQVGVHIDVPPTACAAVFGLPAAALAQCTVDLAEVIGSEAARLVDSVRRAATWPARFAAIDRVLLGVMNQRGGEPPRPELCRAWTELRDQRRVGEVAAALGWSRRHLGSQFHAAFGVGPKVASRLARFEIARRRLQDSGDAAAVAALSGYADQSHLTREWHDFVGLSPTAWLAAEGHVGER